MDDAGEHVASEAVGSQEGLQSGWGLDQVEVLLVGGDGSEVAGEHGRADCEGGHERSRDDDGASEGPAEASTPARGIGAGSGGDDDRLSRELHRVSHTRRDVGGCQGANIVGGRRPVRSHLAVNDCAAPDGAAAVQRGVDAGAGDGWSGATRLL